MKQIIIIILIHILLIIGFCQSPDTINTKVETDSISETDNTSIHAFKKFWNRNNLLQMNHSLSFTFNTSEFSAQWGKLQSGSETYRKYGDINFQHSTAYQIGYADELFRQHVLKPDYGNGMVVPILPLAFLALYGARKGFLQLHKDSLISLDNTDVKILEIIWDNPNITTVDCYQFYNQQNFSEELTYMTLENRLNKLVKQKVIETTTDGEKQLHYNPRYTRQELLQRFEEELIRNNETKHLARNMDIQRMKMLLMVKE